MKRNSWYVLALSLCVMLMGMPSVTVKADTANGGNHKTERMETSEKSAAGNEGERNSNKILHSGKSEDLDWSITVGGHLTVVGNGNYASDTKNFPGWYRYAEQIKTATVEVTGITKTTFMFSGCCDLISVDLSKLDTSQVRDMQGMFSGCRNLSSVDVSKFNTSQVTNMSKMFEDCGNLGSVDVSKFNTSQVTSLQDMFRGCSNLSSVDVSKFNTSQVTSLKGMFEECKNLSSVDVSKFNTSQVTNMSRMFYKCSSLQKIDMSNFNTDQVTSTENLFYHCGSLKSVTMPANMQTEVMLPKVMGYIWKNENGQGRIFTETNLSKSMKYTRIVPNGKAENDIAYKGKSGALDWSITAGGHLNITGNGDYVGVENEELGGEIPRGWGQYSEYIETAVVKVTGITNTKFMFYNCSNLRNIDLRKLDTSQVTDMSGMFEECRNLKNVDVSKFDTSQVTSMEWMFYYCTSLESLDISNFDTSKVTNMASMFCVCSKLESVNVGKLDTSQVTDMNCMFSGCSKLRSLDVSSFDTSKVTNMMGMFQFCSNLRSLDVSNFDTSQVKDICCMFFDCSKLTSLDVSNFDTSQVWDMGAIFQGCSNLSSVDISNFDTSKVSIVTDMSNLFIDCSNLNKIKMPAKVKYKVKLPKVKGYFWTDEKNEERTTVITGLRKPMTYKRHKSVSPTGITLSSKTLTLQKGKNKTLTASVAPDNATNKTVTWDSSNTKVATVDKNGTVNAVAKGTATITAKTANGKKATCKVTVPEVKLSAVELTLQRGKTTTALQVEKKYPSNDKVKKWTSSKKNIATVDENGKLKGIKTGETVITVTMKSGATATCKVKVQKGKVVTESLTMNKKSLTLSTGESSTLSVERNPLTATDKITWVSSNPKVASVNATGKVTAKKAGNTTVTAKSANGKKATCKVTIKAPKVTLQSTKGTVKVGKTITIKITSTYPKDDTVKSYVSSDKKIATVSKNGKVKGIKKGKATITVTMKSGAKAKYQVTVKK